MKITVKVKTNSKEQKITQLDGCTYEVKVKSPPEKGKANIEVIAVLSQYFKVTKSDIVICAGHTNKNKIVEIKKAVDF